MKLGPHTITVVRAGRAPSDYGNRDQLDWDNPTEWAVDGCSVQPAPATAFTVDRDTFITRWQVFAPLGTDVESTDRVLWNGATYDVDGEVLRWEFPGLGHIVLNLRRSTDA